MKLFTKSVALALLCLAFATLASKEAAAQITTGSYTVTGTIGSTTTDFSNAISVAGFNTSLGTLESVKITLSGSAYTTFNLKNNSDSTSNGSIFSITSLSLSDAGGLITGSFSGDNTVDLLLAVTSSGKYGLVGTSYNLAPGASTVITSATTNSNSASYSSAAVLQEFTLTTNGVVWFTVSTSSTATQSNTGGNTDSTQVTTADAAVSVTYTYTPTAVPEPTTWAMLFGGVGTLVLVQQLRRRHHA